MLHSCSNNNVIRNLYKSCLQLIYHDKNTSYEALLLKDGLASIHHKTIQTLAIEMYRVKNNLAPKIVSSIFVYKSNLNII